MLTPPVCTTGQIVIAISQARWSCRHGPSSWVPNVPQSDSLSPHVPELIQAHLRPWLSEWLGRHDLKVSEVNSWAIHPGGPRIGTSVAESLQLSETCVATARSVLAEYGKMSSPTLLFIIERLRREDARLPCVALGFGPGLIAEAALLIES